MVFVWLFRVLFGGGGWGWGGQFSVHILVVWKTGFTYPWFAYGTIRGTFCSKKRWGGQWRFYVKYTFSLFAKRVVSIVRCTFRVVSVVVVEKALGSVSKLVFYAQSTGAVTSRRKALGRRTLGVLFSVNVPVVCETGFNHRREPQ